MDFFFFFSLDFSRTLIPVGFICLDDDEKRGDFVCWFMVVEKTWTARFFIGFVGVIGNADVSTEM